MAQNALTAVEEQVFVVQGTQPIVVGESIAFDVTFSWAASVEASSPAPICTIYKVGTTLDLSDTFLSGSVSVSGNRVTTKTVAGLSARERYVLVITVVIAGDTIKRKIYLICQSVGDA